MINSDEIYMRRCLQLASNGRQLAPPNPMVGAVIVSPDGRIIGEGYHVRCGEGHAEVNAFASVSKEDEHLLPQSTIYVSLEPCAHYGKTPPCAELIVKKGVRRCVVGTIDPFAKVQGRGISRIREAGIEVTVGVLEEECQRLNSHFFTYHSKKRPFITLKWAQTSEGVIGLSSRQLGISTPLTQMVCHRRRTQHQAILVGHHTYVTDHPSLTVREWVGPQPQPVVLATQHINDLPTHWQQYDSIPSMLNALYEQGIQSLLVEGGSQVLQTFIDNELWDEAFVEQGGSIHELAEMNQLDSTDVVYAPHLHKAVPKESHCFGNHTITRYNPF